MKDETTRFLKVSLAGLMLPCLTGCPEMPPPPPPLPETRVGLALVADGFTSPVGLSVPDDGTGRLFVIDQIGRMRIIDADGTLPATPFLDIADRMVELSPGFDERGLLSAAFHPQYAENGRFFVVYNAPLRSLDPQDFNSLWRLSEFRVSADDPDRADAGSEVILLEVLKPQFNHNGGQLAFGPDGMLYASLGDGGGANDVGLGHTPGVGNGQDRTNLLGTILRLDVDTPGALSVPSDNPFVGDLATPDEIFAYGLRNPWRFSFDMAGSRRLFCADAGQNLYEEVSIVESGDNLGWYIKEGTHCFNPDDPAIPPTTCPMVGADGQPLVDPIIEYSRVNDAGQMRLVVVGGYVYRGQEVPALAGRYVFADWSSAFSTPDGTLFLAEENPAGNWGFDELEVTGFPGERINRYILAFGQDREGEVYVLTSQNAGPSGATGAVYKLTPTAP